MSRGAVQRRGRPCARSASPTPSYANHISSSPQGFLLANLLSHSSDLVLTFEEASKALISAAISFLAASLLWPSTQPRPCQISLGKRRTAKVLQGQVALFHQAGKSCPALTVLWAAIATSAFAISELLCNASSCTPLPVANRH